MRRFALRRGRKREGFFLGESGRGRSMTLKKSSKKLMAPSSARDGEGSTV